MNYIPAKIKREKIQSVMDKWGIKVKRCQFPGDECTSPSVSYFLSLCEKHTNRRIETTTGFCDLCGDVTACQFLVFCRNCQQQLMVEMGMLKRQRRLMSDPDTWK